MDQIRIDNLEIYAYHGVYKEETEKGQHFFVNAVLYTETFLAGLKDDLELSTNYGEVCNFINDFMKENTFHLIEAVAEHLARELLLNYPYVKKLDLEIRKPEAPIELPFESVSVKITRGWHEVYLAFGSNMGDKEAHINDGLSMLSTYPGIRVKKASEIIRTTPYGGVEQEEFLNGAVKLETYLEPRELLAVLHEVEAAEERERKVHWGPRTLDLDILFYDNVIMDDEDLMIPHIDMQNRDFVLGPMMELAPGKRHPILGKSIQEMLSDLNAKK